ncbi:hypothetical protein Y1Q_0021250 [Alligator mississippiensis]|uniref:Uncharacterized protein n=1 Tax=Alligator mississippiensis TaxID=8496 RepID=A0A151MSC6_ALLMI|nr:hypothetical protein Y1Q_0021250 [Alligator mississippiensis]
MFLGQSSADLKSVETLWRSDASYNITTSKHALRKKELVLMMHFWFLVLECASSEFGYFTLQQNMDSLGHQGDTLYD